MQLNNQDPAFQGGPGEGAPMEAPASQPPVQAPAEGQPADGQAPAAQSATPIYLGGRRFNSTEELAEYTSNLEREKITWETSRPSAAQEQIIATANQPKLSELLFEDPESALRLVKEQAKEEMRAEANQRTHAQSVITKFYEKYPDLKGNQDLVDLYTDRLAPELGRIDSLEGKMERVARETRRRLNEIKGVLEGGKELPSGQAFVAGAGSGSPSPVVTRTEPVDFVSQMRKIQSQRKKS